MSRPDDDRNLLFGILALHNGFVDRDALIGAMSSWVAEKPTPLGQILVRHGALSPEQHFLMEALVQAHLKQHGDDPAESLAGLNTTALVQLLVDDLADPLVRTSLTTYASRAGDVKTLYEAEPDGPAAGGVGRTSSDGRRFRILRAHAAGGLGEVFLARDEELNREVALKQIKERYGADPALRTRFLAEAEITGGLEHPGVVPVYGLGHDGRGRPFYAMRFIKGESLKEAVERFHRADLPGRDPGERALELRKLLGRFIDVCEAIAYAHSRGVVHRDLKPENVMLGRFGETLVVDWGLAKAVGRDGSITLPEVNPEERTLRPSPGSDPGTTLPGAPVGTPAYMSPEQAACGAARVGPASDVYSLGATLHTILTGLPPVSGSDAGAALHAVRRGDIPPPRAVNPGVPRALDAVCRKAMALDPESRYPSAQALAEDIEHWLADEPVSAYRDGLPARLARWARRKRAWAAAAVAVLAAVAVASTVSALLIEGARRRERADLTRAARAGADAVRHAIGRLDQGDSGAAGRLLKGAVRRLGPAGGTPPGG